MTIVQIFLVIFFWLSFSCCPEAAISEFSGLIKQLDLLRNDKNWECRTLIFASRQPVQSSEDFMRVKLGSNSSKAIDGLQLKFLGGLSLERGNAFFTNISSWTSPMGCCIDAAGGCWKFQECAFFVGSNPATCYSGAQSLILAYGDAILNLSCCTLDGVFSSAFGGDGCDQFYASQVHGITGGAHASIALSDMQLCRLRVGIHAFGSARCHLVRAAISQASISLVLDDTSVVSLCNVSLSTDGWRRNSDTPPAPSVLLPVAAGAGGELDEPGCIACLSPTASLDAVDVAHAGPLWAHPGIAPARAIITRARPAAAAAAAAAAVAAADGNHDVAPACSRSCRPATPSPPPARTANTHRAPLTGYSTQPHE
jgi:hypothetical protein